MQTDIHAPWPPHFVNGYLESQLKRFEIIPPTQTFSAFIPVGPNSVDELYKEFIGDLPTIILYEKLARFRSGPFYRNKREQIMYNITGKLEDVMDASRVIQAALDREDASAQDVNKWIITDWSNEDIPNNVFFHRFKAFQIDETRDLLELSSVRTLYKAKVIVEYDYHTKDPLDAFYD
jgi:hypothetical protein